MKYNCISAVTLPVFLLAAHAQEPHSLFVEAIVLHMQEAGLAPPHDD
jgi:hypothetical protein